MRRPKRPAYIPSWQRRQKQRKYHSGSAIPNEPILVLTWNAETPQEISYRTGLPIKPLCEALIQWWRAGKIIGAKIESSHCSIPVFRLPQIWDRMYKDREPCESNTEAS